MDKFTLPLALVDLVPVIAFGAAIIIVALNFGSPLFLLGAILSLLAGMCKVLWKLILSTKDKDITWLNRGFIPMQCLGWAIMLLSIVLNIRMLDFPEIFAVIIGMPQLVFYIIWLLFLSAMVLYKRKYFKQYSARSNWIAEIINSLGQSCFLIAVIISIL